MTPLEQLAQARKYDVNLTWLIAELEPDTWCLYSPVRREPVCIGTLDEIIAAYRSREPFVPYERTAVRKSRRFENVIINL